MVRRTALAAICLMFFLVAGCWAEERKEEWREKAFDFRNVRTLVVQLAVSNDAALSDVERKSLEELFAKQVIKAENQRVVLIAKDELENRIGKIVGKDMRLLAVEDNARYKEVMKEYAPQVADGVLTVSVRALGTSQVYVPERVYYYTTYQTQYIQTPVYHPNGGVSYITQAIQVPVQNVGVTPAHYETIGHAGAEFTLVAGADRQKVWILVDMRDGNGKVPLEMTGRIFKRAMDQFRKLTG
jgi:hypothetical protein